MFTDLDDYSHVAVRTALATLICTLIDWTERADGGNHPLIPVDHSGYDRHPIAVTDTAFHHSWAVDVDIRTDNPVTLADRRDIPAHVARVWHRYGFGWGAEDQRPNGDWMHFEFMGTPIDAVAFSRAALHELAA